MCTCERALVPLLWVHAGRYVPLALLAPGQIGSAVPERVAWAIAGGDFAAAGLALVALLALHRRGAGGLPWVWLFSVVSTVDIGVALAVGLGNGVQHHPLGVSWFVLTLYVPAVCVSQILIGGLLFRPQPASRGASGPVSSRGRDAEEAA